MLHDTFGVTESSACVFSGSWISVPLQVSLTVLDNGDSFLCLQWLREKSRRKGGDRDVDKTGERSASVDRGLSPDLLFPFPCFLAAFLQFFFVSVFFPLELIFSFFLPPWTSFSPPLLVLIWPLLSRYHIFRPILKWALYLRHQPIPSFLSLLRLRAQPSKLGP